MAGLPPEIIEDILLRVPVRSLLKFKRVSKGWASLIDSEYFIQTHLEVSKRNTSRQMLLYSGDGDDDFVKYSSLSSLLCAQVDGCDIPTPLKRSDFIVSGICNGIICLRIRNWELRFWNPATGYIKRLPDWIDREKDYKFYGLGFGFDELSSDYKVVVIVRAFVGRRVSAGIQSHVYSSKHNSWRQIDFSNSDRVTSVTLRGVFYRGKLHWFGHRARIWRRNKSRSRDYSSIVSFDLSKDAFKRTFVPPKTLVGSYWSYLVVANERLCIISWRVLWETADFWILQEHGGRGDWERVVSVDFARIHFPIAQQPCYLGEEGDLLFRDVWGIRMHDSKDMTVKEVGDFGQGCNFTFGALFVESLVRDI